jgi:transposase
MSRREITAEQWALIAPFIPKQKAAPGRKRNNDHLTINGLLVVLRTGRTWGGCAPAWTVRRRPAGGAFALGPRMDKRRGHLGARAGQDVQRDWRPAAMATEQGIVDVPSLEGVVPKEGDVSG